VIVTRNEVKVMEQESRAVEPGMILEDMNRRQHETASPAAVRAIVERYNREGRNGPPVSLPVGTVLRVIGWTSESDGR
jgi:hypothetical protein